MIEGVIVVAGKRLINTNPVIYLKIIIMVH